MQTQFRRMLVRSAVFGLLFGVAAPAALALAPNGKPETFLDYWNQGGPTMWPLLGSAVWATAVIIECFVKLRTKYFMPPDILRQITESLTVSDFQKAWRIGMENPAPLTRIFCAAIERLPKGREAVEESAAEAAAYENNSFRLRMSYINLNATVAPLLGLFGTISGMVGAFNAMAFSGAVGDPTKLAGDIGEALITTYTGLIIAIPALCIYYVLGNFLRKLMERVQKTLTTMLELVNFDELPPDLVVVTKEMKAAALSGGDLSGGGAKTGSKGPKTAATPAAEAAAEIVPCPNCKKDITVGAKRCPHCNTEMEWE